MKKQKSVTASILICFLSFTEISYAGLSDGLAAYYPFNGNANDASGNQNHGVVNGATLTADRFGNPENAYSFDGVNDYIVVSDSSSLRPNGHMLSVSLWIKPSHMTEDLVLIRKGIGCYVPGWSLQLDNGFETAGWDAVNGESWHSNSTQILVEDNWYFLSLVTDGTVAKTYINGILDGTIEMDTSISIDTNYPISIGANKGICDSYHLFYKGVIDDIRIYNRALSELEVQELYNGETSCTSGVGTVSPNLDIHAPSLNYQTLLGTQNIWVDLEFYGQSLNGELLWKLKDFGVNQ